MANALFEPDSVIMQPQSFARAENCADVAIPLIATGGCRAVSAGVLANRLHVTPAAAAKWFGSAPRMWEHLTDVIGRRWIFYLDLYTRLSSDGSPRVCPADLDVFQWARLFLPLDQDEIEWTRVWLSLLEHGRHHDLVGNKVAISEAQEMEVLYRATLCRSVRVLTATLVVIRGLRQMVAATHRPLDLEAAHKYLRSHIELTYVTHGVPEPVSDEDVLTSTTRFTYFAPRPG